MTLSRWEQYKQKNGVTVFDSIKAEKLLPEQSEKRYAVCLECPELIKLTKQCKKCGCFMQFKATLKDAKCPIGKW